MSETPNQFETKQYANQTGVYWMRPILNLFYKKKRDVIINDIYL